MTASCYLVVQSRDTDWLRSIDWPAKLGVQPMRNLLILSGQLYCSLISLASVRTLIMDAFEYEDYKDSNLKMMLLWNSTASVEGQWWCGEASVSTQNLPLVRGQQPERNQVSGWDFATTRRSSRPAYCSCCHTPEWQCQTASRQNCVRLHTTGRCLGQQTIFINTLECPWSGLGRQVSANHPSPASQRQLLGWLQQVCYAIPQIILADLVDSMRLRCLDYLSSNGGHTPGADKFRWHWLFCDHTSSFIKPKVSKYRVD